jgi:putative peptidoglycan lipid II flippase
LLLLGRPLIQVVYQRGAFDPQATEAVYIALSFYALGLVGHSCLELAARAFFALQDTLTPLLIAAATGAFQVLLALVLMRGLGHGGLALANSVAITLEVLVLLYFLRRRLGGVEGRETLLLAGQVGMACLAMGLAVGLITRLLADGTSTLANALLLLVAGAVLGASVYLVAGFLLKIPTLQRLPVYLPAMRWKV